jgi:hypothetical protein
MEAKRPVPPIVRAIYERRLKRRCVVPPDANIMRKPEPEPKPGVIYISIISDTDSDSDETDDERAVAPVAPCRVKQEPRGGADTAKGPVPGGGAGLEPAPAMAKRVAGRFYLLNGKRRKWSGKRWLCQHGKVQSVCEPCGGSGICTHGQRRDRCHKCWLAKRNA